MTDPIHSNPGMIPWKSCVQYAGLRSREILNQRQPALAQLDDEVTAVDDRPCLLIHCSERAMYYWFDTKGSWRVGRSPDCDIVLPDQCISRYHASIQMLESDEFYLMDLNSYNGSFINGRRVREISRLYSGDRISLGQLELEFYGRIQSPRVAKFEEATVELK